VWGRNVATRAFWGRGPPGSSAEGIVATRLLGKRLKCRRDQTAIVLKLRRRADQYQWAVDVSEPWGGSAGGSQQHGPTMRTDGGQSERGYSNGSAVM